MTVRAAIPLVLFLFLSFAAAASAAETTLLVLQREAAGAEALRITDEAGTVESPQAGARSPGWNIGAGEVVRGRERPADRQVDLYRGRPGPRRELLCTFLVRYVPVSEGWAPRYRLHEEPFVARQGGRWVPILDHEPSVILQAGNTFPDREGYYPSLGFVITIGSPVVDAWRVGPVTVDPQSSGVIENGS